MAGAPLRLTLGTARLRGKPGQSVELSLTVQHTFGRGLRIRLTAEPLDHGIAGDWFLIASPGLVEPGRSIAVPGEVQLPARSVLRPGHYRFRVSARADGEPGVLAVADGVLEVEGERCITFPIPKISLQRDGTLQADCTIGNCGAVEVHCAINARCRDGRFQIEVDHPEITVGVAGVAEVKAVLRPLGGQERSWPSGICRRIELRCTPDGDAAAAASQEVDVSIEPSPEMVHRWRQGAVGAVVGGILTVAAAIAVVAVVASASGGGNNNRSARSNSPNTALTRVPNPLPTPVPTRNSTPVVTPAPTSVRTPIPTPLQTRTATPVPRSVTPKPTPPPPLPKVSIDVSASTAAGLYEPKTWTNQPITVHVACSGGDGSFHIQLGNESGTGTPGPTHDVPIGKEGANQSVNAICRDGQGSTASSSFGPINLDTTKPVVTVASPANTSYLLNQRVTAGFSCSDPPGSDHTAGSDIALCTAQQGGATKQLGDVVDTASAGRKTFTAGATDRAGNRVDATVSYAVLYNVKQVPTGQLNVVIQLVDASGKNVSSASLPVTERCIVPAQAVLATSTDPLSCPAPSDAAAFQFISNGAGSPGYMFSPSLRVVGESGSWDVRFTVGNDPHLYSARYVAGPG